MSHEFTFESIEREYERYWREFIAMQIEDAIQGSLHTETQGSHHEEAKWFREGLRFALILTRYTESDDPIASDIPERLRRRHTGEEPPESLGESE